MEPRYRYQGKDRPYIRSIRLWYIRSRCQARFRGEEFAVSWTHFLSLWLTDNQWQSHGTGSLDLCFGRWDCDLPWTDSNTLIISRQDYLKRRFSRENNSIPKNRTRHKQNLVRKIEA